MFSGLSSGSFSVCEHEVEMEGAASPPVRECRHCAQIVVVKKDGTKVHVPPRHGVTLERAEALAKDYFFRGVLDVELPADKIESIRFRVWGVSFEKNGKRKWEQYPEIFIFRRHSYLSDVIMTEIHHVDERVRM
jgi:hypothetical protein